VNWVAFSPDSQWLASASDDRTIKLWEIAAASPAQTLRGHSDAVVAVEFSPDGRLLASAGADTQLRLWDRQTRGLRAALPAHAGRIESLAFAPDGRQSMGHSAPGGGRQHLPAALLLATASRDGTAKLWPVAYGKPPASVKPRAVSAEAPEFWVGEP